MTAMRNAYEVLLENLYRRYGWELNMKRDLTGRGREGVDWIMWLRIQFSKGFCKHSN
jgi:hypothetical protein